MEVIRYRALHDFDFLEAQVLCKEWKDFVRSKPNKKRYNLELRWQLLE